MKPGFKRLTGLRDFSEIHFQRYLCSINDWSEKINFTTTERYPNRLQKKKKLQTLQNTTLIDTEYDGV